jgi:hypothetical protein
MLCACESLALALFLEPFKAAAAEAAALELKLRLLAGTVPALAVFTNLSVPRR